MNNDILFFRIWKDLYLNKKIFNNLKVNRINGSSFRFDEIISCSWLIDNNHLDLLFKKVIGSEYLVFDQVDSLKHGNSTPFSFFKTVNFRQSWLFNSHEFYLNLFKNYSNYFTSNKSVLKTALLAFIKYDLHIGVQILLDRFINMEDIDNDFHNKEKEVTGLNYIILKSISHYSLNSLNVIHSKLSSPPSSNSRKYKNNIFWEKIFSNNFYGSQRLKSPIKLYGILECMINKMNIKLPSIPLKSKKKSDIIGVRTVTYHFLNIRIFNITVSTLLDCCMILNLVGDYLKPFLEMLSNKSYISPKEFEREEYSELLYEDKPNEILSIDKLNEIKSNFKQLGILDMVVSDVNIDNQDIKYLFKLVMPFTSFYYLMENLSFYQIKYNFNYSSDAIGIIESYPTSISPISFGDFNEIAPYQKNAITESVSLFKYCKHDKEKQIKFINDAIDYLKDTNSRVVFELNRNIITIETLYELLFEIDHTEFIQYVYSQLSSPSSSLPVNVFSLIKSIDTFDFIYNCNGIDKSKFTLKILEEDIKNDKIYQHFKSFYPTDYHSMVAISMDKLLQVADRDEISFSTVVYSIEKGILHANNFNTIWFAINLYELSASQIIWLIENTPLNKYYSLERHSYGTKRIKINIELELLHWIHENRIQDIDSKRCQFDLDVFCLYHYLNNTLHSILQQHLYSSTFPQNSKLVFKEIAKRSDINSLNLILSKYYKNEVYQYLENEKNELYHLFIEATTYGSIGIFKYIVENYSFLLSIHQPSIWNILFNSTKAANTSHKLTKSNLNTIQNILEYKGHTELILYFKNTILLKPIQSSNIYIF